MENVPQTVIDYQSKVFNYFAYQIIQVRTSLTHAAAIDEFLNSEKWKSISIFDIDCIPIQENVIEEAKMICQKNVLYGSAQQANHLPIKNVYVAPSFFNISYDLFNRIGKPSFRQTKRSDVGGEISEICRELGVPIKVLYPTDVEYRKWALGDTMSYGLGTTYGHKVYHAFRIRNPDCQQRFIDRCIKIVGN